MTIARVSRAGRSEDLQSLEAATESERRDKDELENDADHKELMSAYDSDDYLLRWLPNIVNHEHVSPATTKASQCEERRDKEEENSKRLCTTSVSSETFLKSTSRYHQIKETDVYISSGNKVFRETGRPTYFEAIKCSPIKPRQSITTHKRPDVSSLIVSQQHSTQKPVKETVPAFEITQEPVRQLGSLCFQTKNARRRDVSEATYSSYRLVGGNMSTRRRNTHYKTAARKGSELRVRCESVMIYPKALVPSGNEKPLKKPTKPRKEAWRETFSVLAALKSDDDYTKLPHLGAKKTSEEKQNRKLSPELEGSLKAEQEQKQSFQSPSDRSTSMKVIIPFGENQEPQETVEGFGKPMRPATLKPDVLERKSSQAPSKVHNEQNSRKKGEHFYDNQKEYSPNSPEKSRRRLTSMVITQLERPQKTLCNNPSSASAAPSAPSTKIKTGTADTNGLFLGRENLLRQRAGARFSYNQRRRAPDLGTQNKERVLPERLDHEGGKWTTREANGPRGRQMDHEGGKCFLSTENGVSLTIGGTGLLREQRKSHENFGKGEEIKDTDEQPGYFRNSLPHSHYIT